MKSLPCDWIVRAQVGPRDENVATNGPTDKQRELLSRLARIDEMNKGGQATLSLLERERLQLQTQLRLSGYRMPVAPE